MDARVGFSHDLIEVIRCRRDSGRLVLSEADGDRFIRNGLLTCDRCGAGYRFQDGILDTINEANGIGREMKQEIVARDEGAETYDDFTDQAWYRLEIPTTLDHLDGIDGKRVIEFGSGTGRCTLELVKRAAGVVAIDFSRASHEVLQRKLTGQPQIGLIQGDITQLKLEPESFDVAVSTQLLEHVPSEEKRRSVLQSAHDCLKPGGYFLLTAYYQDMRRRLKRQPREGFHESGIFYHYFNERELRREFSPLFEVVHLHPFLFHVPLIWRLEFTLPWIGTICERTPFLREFGSLILVKAVKRG